MRYRRGYSLLELLIVLAVGTAMLMVAMSVLYMLKETQDNVRQRLTSGRMITRLADQFREDVHKATGVERVTGDGASSGEAVWQFTIQPDTTVRYEIGDDEVRREQVSEGETIHEDYQLPRGIGAALIPPEQDSAITSLRFEAIDPSEASPRPIQIEAVMGFTNRHTPQEERASE